MAKHQGWTFRDGNAGWGAYDAMLATMESAIANGDFVLGHDFSMADVVFGGTVRFMLMFKLIEPRPALTAYVERLSDRPAAKRADARNAAVREERGLAG
jgi:glutathione S-transferase